MEDDDHHHRQTPRHTPTTLLQHFSTTYSNSINRFPFFFNRRIMTSPSNPPTPSVFQSEDWSSYFKPLIIVDVVWNLAFVFVSLLLLLSTLKERPSTPLRVWIGGYGLQCLLHVGFVYAEHRQRERGLDGAGAGAGAGDGDAQNLLYTSSETRLSSVTKRLESMNTMVSFFWWVVGFYWIVVGGQALLQDAPRLKTLLECCICLSKYVDGVELHGLPCNHYFHSGCIVRWLRINAK